MLRLMEQIITITLIVFCLLVIYNLFSFQYGFATYIGDNDIDILTIKHLQVLEINNSYFVIFETESNNYWGIVNEDSAITIAIITILSSGEGYNNLSIWPLIIGLVLILLVIIYPILKKPNKNEHKSSNKVISNYYTSTSDLVDEQARKKRKRIFLIIRLIIFFIILIFNILILYYLLF